MPLRVIVLMFCLAGLGLYGFADAAAPEVVSSTASETPALVSLGANPVISVCVDEYPKLSYLNWKEPDEMLYWHFDAERETVSFTNINIWLNCCGYHEISIINEPGTSHYEIREIDRAEIFEGSEARCGCTCLFDYGIDLPKVGGTIEIAVVRQESSEIRQLLYTSIDLTEEYGAILIRRR